jgi:hypothetical protein
MIERKSLSMCYLYSLIESVGFLYAIDNQSSGYTALKSGNFGMLSIEVSLAHTRRERKNHPWFVFIDSSSRFVLVLVLHFGSVTRETITNL